MVILKFLLTIQEVLQAPLIDATPHDFEKAFSKCFSLSDIGPADFTRHENSKLWEELSI